MSKKQKELIEQLQDDLLVADSDYQDLARDYNDKCNQLFHSARTTTETKSAKVQRSYAGDIAFDYWPPSDWLRLNLDKWAPGRYFQLCIGPLRFEFYES